MTWVHASDARLDLAPDELVLLLGGKAANIATMAVDLGLPVPPACTITTGACRAYLATGWPDGRWWCSYVHCAGPTRSSRWRHPAPEARHGPARHGKGQTPVQWASAACELCRTTDLLWRPVLVWSMGMRGRIDRVH